MSQKNIIDQMWNEHIKNKGGICMVCNVCGGGYAWNCHCARARFNPSQAEIEKFIIDQSKQRQEDLARRERFILQELERIQQERKMMM